MSISLELALTDRSRGSAARAADTVFGPPFASAGLTDVGQRPRAPDCFGVDASSSSFTAVSKCDVSSYWVPNRLCSALSAQRRTIEVVPGGWEFNRLLHHRWKKSVASSGTGNLASFVWVGETERDEDGLTLWGRRLASLATPLETAVWSTAICRQVAPLSQLRFCST